MMRSRPYRVLLILAAIVGLIVSLVCWGFLELVHVVQQEVYDKLPGQLGFSSEPWWWPLPVLLVAGLVTAFAIYRLPGKGGHVPYLGFTAGQPLPSYIPGIALAGLASLGLGLVLGPEAPLIAIGTGLGILAIHVARKDSPNQVVAVVAAAGAFAAVATIFGSPLIGAVILIEAAGLGGATLPVVLLPGLLAAGIGSLCFTGVNHWTGLSNSDYALNPFTLPTFTTPTFADIGWTLLLSAVAAVAVYAIIQLARASAAIVDRAPWVLLPAAGLLIGGFAIAFSEIAHEASSTVLFSGQDAFSQVFAIGPTAPISVLLWLLLFKGLAWGLSLGSFRGGPTFPAIFMGAVGGLLAAHLPGLSETPAVAVLIGATVVAMLRLPLSSILLAILLTSHAGAGSAPLVIIGVVVAYLVTLALRARFEPAPAPAPSPAAAAEGETTRAGGTPA